jgi:hypothetical protein
MLLPIFIVSENRCQGAWGKLEEEEIHHAGYIYNVEINVTFPIRTDKDLRFNNLQFQ